MSHPHRTLIASRRAFLAGTGMTALTALTLAACGDNGGAAGSGAWRPLLLQESQAVWLFPHSISIKSRMFPMIILTPQINCLFHFHWNLIPPLLNNSCAG